MYSKMDEVKELVSKFSVSLNNPDFYIPKILEFFRTYMGLPDNRNIPLDAITYDHVNRYLGEYVNKNRSNQYYGLKKFFDFTYKERRTQEIMLRVPSPGSTLKDPVYISDDHMMKMSEFVLNEKEDIVERIFLGLFLFTGLSRRFIWSLENKEIVENFDTGTATLYLNTPEAVIPVTPKFASILIQYKRSINVTDVYKRVFAFKVGEDANRLLKKLCKRIIGTTYTPTQFSYSFIKKCLDKNKDIVAISKLMLENPAAIIRHIEIDPEVVYERQNDLLRELF